MNKLQIIIEKNQDGLWGQVKQFPGVFSYGQSIEELTKNIRDALFLYFEESKLPIPDIDFELLMDLQHFFEVNDYINISKLAERTGMNKSLLRQYARGIKYPGIQQVSKIEKALNDIGHELMNTQLVTSTHTGAKK